MFFLKHIFFLDCPIRVWTPTQNQPKIIRKRPHLPCPARPYPDHPGVYGKQLPSRIPTFRWKSKSGSIDRRDVTTPPGSAGGELMGKLPVVKKMDLFQGQGCRFVPHTCSETGCHRWYLWIYINIGFQGLAA